MKRAKIILTFIVACGLVGGALAFKASRFDDNLRLGLSIANSTTVTTFTNAQGIQYTATIPYCVTTQLWRTNVGGGLVNTFSTTKVAAVTTVGTAPSGQTTTFPYHYCVAFQTRTTDEQP
jgi:hypothetical protein